MSRRAVDIDADTRRLLRDLLGCRVPARVVALELAGAWDGPTIGCRRRTRAKQDGRALSDKETTTW